MGKTTVFLKKSKRKHLPNGNDGYFFQETGSADVTEKHGWRGEDAALKARTETKKIQWHWEEESFKISGYQKAKEDFQGNKGVSACSDSLPSRVT